MPDPRSAPTRDHIIVPAPAAGAEWLFTNDKGERLLITHVAFQLVTSAVAGSRAPSLQAKRDVDLWAKFGSGGVQITGLTRTYCAFPGAAGGADSAGAVAIAWPTDGLTLDQGYTLGSQTPSLDVGDQYSRIVLTVFRLIPSYPENLEPVPSLYMHNLNGA